MTSEPDAQHTGPGGLSRRHALAAVATVGVGVPLLAACGSEDGSGGASNGTGGAGSPAPSPPAGGGLVSTADVPVGGGVVLGDDDVVVVQPTEGEFRGWSATCTHQGCTVARVEEGRIVCPCHNSTFSIEDGTPQGGPAQTPLTEVRLTVDEDSISLA